MPESVFPLPLKGFEELFVVDDRPPHYPAAFSFQLTFDHSLDTTRAQQALDMVVARQPMLRSRLETVGGSDQAFRWIEDRSCQPQVNVCEARDGTVDRFKPFDLPNEPPFELTLQVQPTGTQMTLRFHHAAFDGLGALQVMGNWMRAYDGLVAGTTTDSSASSLGYRLDLPMLATRCTSGLSLTERLRLMPLGWLSSLGFWYFFRHRPIPLAPANRVTPAPEAGSSMVVHRLNQSVTQRLAARAKEVGVTANDAIVAELYPTLKQWQAENQIAPVGSHFRVTVPINERTARHRRMPACNHCTMISLDERPAGTRSRRITKRTLWHALSPS